MLPRGAPIRPALSLRGSDAYMSVMTDEIRPPKVVAAENKVIAAEKKERRAADGKKAMADHVARQAFVKQNTVKLRELRLAREAAEREAARAQPASVAAPKRKRRPTEPLADA